MPKLWIRASIAGVIFAIAAVTAIALEDPLASRVILIAGAALALWLSELVPAFVPTLIVWAAVPVLLGSYGPKYSPTEVLRWSADPVLALFFGGFALAVSARRYAIDALIAGVIISISRGSRVLLIGAILAGTSVMSMWISNIAASAMMLAVLRPILDRAGELRFRRALLLAIAIGANFGGMATPIGTGPNAIAVATLGERGVPVTFLQWMSFALPLVGLMLSIGFVILVVAYRVRGRDPTIRVERSTAPSAARTQVMALFFVSVALWLTEPLHGVPASIVALGAATLLFVLALLDRNDFKEIDWSTLVLIAGGIALGKLLEQSGVIARGSELWRAAEMSQFTRVFVLVFASALLSALMSNTATVTMLAPLAFSIDGSPQADILVAIGASFGVPFVISTPPNAMVYGAGGVRAADFAAIGLPLMVSGCLLISATGPFVLSWLGVR